MNAFRPIYLFLVIVTLLVLSLGNGCATLPEVSQIVEEAPTAQTPRIVSERGPLSLRESRSLLERLKRSAQPTDLMERHAAVLELVWANPLTKGNRVTLLTDGKATFAAMFKALQSARDHINLETFKIDDDETGRRFSELLRQKQAAGVQVNFIYDSVGSLSTPPSFFQQLRDAGIRVVAFNPIIPVPGREEWGLTHRDHRKLLIVDGRIAIMGGVNISKVYSYSMSAYKRERGSKAPVHWRDTDIQIEGPVVAEFQKLFLDTWKRQKGPQLPDRTYFPDLREKGTALVRAIGSTPGQNNRVPFIAYVSAIDFARKSVHLTNSYFVPDDQMTEALTGAAKRGVDVKIILPGISDSKLALYAQRHHYSELLDSGVKIYEHSTALLHAKTAVIDSVWSTVGSTNMDFLSLLKNDEVNAIILSREFAGEMEGMFARDLADSKPIRREDWKRRPALPRVRDWFVNLFLRWL